MRSFGKCFEIPLATPNPQVACGFIRQRTIFRESKTTTHVNSKIPSTKNGQFRRHGGPKAGFDTDSHFCLPKYYFLLKNNLLF